MDFKRSNAHFEVRVYAKNAKLEDKLTSADADVLFKALKKARKFYNDAGFNVPGKQTVTMDACGATSGSWPNIFVSLTSPTPETIRFTAAHEYFHKVMFQNNFGLKTAWLTQRKKKHKGSLKKARQGSDRGRKFWPVFEGLPEAMAWMAFPEDAAANEDSRDSGLYWYRPKSFELSSSDLSAGIGADAPLGCTNPHEFFDPWVVPLWNTGCAPTFRLHDLEHSSYFTAPYWIALAHLVDGGASRGDYSGSAKAIRRLWTRIENASGRWPEKIEAGTDAFLAANGLTRAAVRDHMSIAAGVELYHDEEKQTAPGGYYSSIFRDVERIGRDPENHGDHLSWLTPLQLAEPVKPSGVKDRASLLKANTVNFVPALPIGDAGGMEPGRLVEFRFERTGVAEKPNKLPAFAGVESRAKHPLLTQDTPPAALLAFESGHNKQPKAAAITGVRKAEGDESHAFPARAVLIAADPEPLPLNSFDRRDLSIFAPSPRHALIQYRYDFLGQQSKLAVVTEPLSFSLAPSDWAIVRLPTPELPPRRQKPSGNAPPPSETIVGSIMVAPKGKPRKGTKIAGSNPPLWMDSEIFDMVLRSQDHYGIWRSDVKPGAAILEGGRTIGFEQKVGVKETWHYTFRASRPQGVPAELLTTGSQAEIEDIDKRFQLRVDIAQSYSDGDARVLGGGAFDATYVNRDLEAQPGPDLLVRHVQGRYLKNASDQRSGFEVDVYIMNQGNKGHCRDVNGDGKGDLGHCFFTVRLSGEYSYTKAGRVIVEPFKKNIKLEKPIKPGGTTVVTFREKSYAKRKKVAFKGVIKIDSRNDIPNEVIPEKNNIKKFALENVVR